MTINTLLLPILIPLISALFVLCVPKKFRWLKEIISLLATLINLCLAILLFKSRLTLSFPWMGFGIDFSLKANHFSNFTLLATAGFGFLICLYSVSFMRAKQYANQFYCYFLATIAFVNAAALSDNLILMLFFWEGLLAVQFGFIAIGNKNAFKTATKAFIIVGISDLMFMAGIILANHLSGTLAISKINLSLGGLGTLSFILLMIGAISKAGSMPFHSWIPDAAVDAPLPFMAILPASLEKLLGIYFLARISLDMFKLDPSSWLSTLMMIIGSITIIFAVMMALIQKDYKRLLSYHAISQVGYMILGIGTALPIGIVGGLFHMLNNAMYKSCLFLTGGAVEKQAGSTNLEKLGGLYSKMPLTFICFAITAVSISGVPPFNGFFSKELIYDAALERHMIFYIAAALGSFFTAASFLKLGHAAFLGKVSQENKNVREAPITMLLPMAAIAIGCIIFGVYNWLPLKILIQPILGAQMLEGVNFYGWPANTALVLITLAVLLLALVNHILGVRMKGSGLKAADYIHYAPLLSAIYEKAERRVFDPYEFGLKITHVFSRLGYGVDRIIDALSDNIIVGLTFSFTNKVRRLHTGSYVLYLAWSLIATAAILATIFIMHLT